MRSFWIMRHGEANWDAVDDQSRELTAGGIQQARSVADKMRLSGEFLVWSSPYQRAQKTCETVIEQSGISVLHQVEEKLLTPDSNPQTLWELIEVTEFDQLILFSHMPLVARLIEVATGDSRIGGFQTGQCVQCVQKEPGSNWGIDAIFTPNR